MPSVTIRPALVGKFATVLEEVAIAQGMSTAAVLRQLMTEAWGPNLENAPVGMTVKPDSHTRQVSPSNPVAMPVHPTGTARPPNPAPDDLFAQSA